MQISCVEYKNLDQGTRLDAEYYKPVFLEIEKILQKVGCKFLDDVSKSIKSFGAYALCNEMVLVEEGIPFIRCKDIKEGFVDFSEVLFIDEATNRLLSKSIVVPYIVMLTMSGTVGNSAVADPTWKYPVNSNQDIAKIETNEFINPYYLAIFFYGKYGKSQTERLPIGSIQQHIFIWQLKCLLIFIASKNFQDAIAKLYIKAIKSLRESKVFYRDAEQVLLTEIGISTWNPKNHISFIKNFSNIQASDRIDAEYFQPKYDEIINAIKSYQGGWDLLGNLVEIKDQNFSPIKDQEYKYIELANIGSNGEITGYTTSSSDDLPSRARRKVMTKDLIVSSIEGSLPSIALVENDLNDALCSTGFYVINSDQINSETLLVFLKSFAGQMLLKKGCSGTILTAINKDELSKIVIPKFDAGVQSRIKEKITQVYNQRKKSKQLLEIAKRGVEIAIEKDENTAQKWIDEQLKINNLRL